MESQNVINKYHPNAKIRPVVHPGEILREELQTRKLGKSLFAMNIKVYPSQFSDILHGKRDINAALAIKLEVALGISAEFWMRLQSEYDLAMERHKMQEA